MSVVRTSLCGTDIVFVSIT